MVCKFSFSYKNREIFVDFFYMHYFVCFKNEEKKISTATSKNKNYINDFLKYFPQGINYIFLEFFTFYRLY